MTRRYPACKDSGVEWLGEVPDGWEVSPLKHIADFINGSAFKPETWSEVGTPIIRIENLNGGNDFNCYDGEVDERYIVNQGDILFGWSGNRGTSFGPFIWGTPGRFYLNQHIFNVQGYSCDRLWFYWCLRAVTEYVEQQAHGIIGMVHVTKGNLGAVNIPLPSFSEQTAIAAFLDRETAKIDALVAEQRRLIDLLREKRQAVISHAVTKGLNPNAPLKPSGIDWLGDVPEGWEVCQLKRVFKQVDYGISDSLSAEGSVGILRMGNISEGQVVLDDLKYADDVPPDLMLKRDDLLFNRTNSLDLIGKVGRFEPVDDSKISFASYLVRLRLKEDYGSPRFFAYLLNTPAILGEARANALVAIGQCNLNPTRYGQFWIALPPKDEQEEIAAYLNARTAKLDTLTTTAETAIALLQERRAALISAAVTGKIDVRHLSPAATEAA